MSNWYEEMAVAVKKRELALNGLKRWQAKVDEAEAEIARITADRQNSDKSPGTDTEPAPVAAAPSFTFSEPA